MSAKDVTISEMREYITGIARRLEDEQLLQMLHLRASVMAKEAAGSGKLRNEDFATDTRQRIAAMLEKIVSESNLNRIYRFVKYIYLHKERERTS